MAVVAPSNLVINATYEDRIYIGWTNPSYPDNYDGVHIQRKIGAGSWVTIQGWVTPPPSFY